MSLRDTNRTMPSKNPPWNRDELLLALDLYFRLGRRVPDPNEPEVAEISALLNSSGLADATGSNSTFRNISGIRLKLANFLALDRPGHGMPNVGRLDRVVWNQYGNDPTDLNALATAIRHGLTAPQQVTGAGEDESDDDARAFPEGRVLWRMHRRYERDSSLVRKKKACALLEHGRLACEVCNFDFERAYGELGNGFIECHHVVPVYQLGESGRTRLKDLMLVCSNCHRMLHRMRPWPTPAAMKASLLARKPVALV